MPEDLASAPRWRRVRRAGAAIVVGVALAGGLAGCATGGDDSYRESLRSTMEVLKVERGEIIAVNDVVISPIQARKIIAQSNDGRGGASGMSATPVAPPRRGVAIPGGKMVPGEEITVQVSGGRLLMIVQEQSRPAMAKGERVKVVTQQPAGGLGYPETLVVREQ